MNHRMTLWALALCIATPALGAGDAEKGAIVFHNHCDFCHSFRLEDGNGSGPNLSSVVGRKAGTFPDFGYSKTMKELGVIWDEHNLTTFVQGPSAMVPGTRMIKVRPVTPDDLPDLIAYVLAAGSPAAAPSGNLPISAAPAAAPPPTTPGP